MTTSADVAQKLAEELAEAAGGTVRAIFLYGSRLSGAQPDRYSAYDFVVVVDTYRAFYRTMARNRAINRPAWLLVMLSHLLPPNVVAFAPRDGADGLAKCLVINPRGLARGLSLVPPDHFLMARMVQRVRLVWVRDEATEQGLERLLAAARRGVLAWVGPFLPERFDAETVGRTLLDVCYRAELRPEAGNRSTVVFENQTDFFRETYGPILERAAARGLLERSKRGGYRFAVPPPALQRVRWSVHFKLSRLRVTARWLKHVMTFDQWLPYAQRKVERRTGMEIHLTTLERKLPLIFLWPRVIGIFLARPPGVRGGADAGETTQPPPSDDEDAL